MLYSQLGQAELLFCGCLFCLVIALCMYLSNNFDSEKRKWLLLMQIIFITGTQAILFHC